ncbi:MAG: hypothetical protein PHO86_06335 [Bacilli bacterium]|nr:hypothetical protein [Bacilli bacterium]
MKNNNKQQEKKPLIKTKMKPDGGVEVELQKSPGNTVVGKIFAIAIAFITVFGGVFALIYLLTQI